MECPVCHFGGSLHEVRAHLTVQARIDEAHSDWLREQEIRLGDDTQASMGELTRALADSE